MSLVELMGQWSFGALDWLVIGLGIALAYIVFGIAGFGTALVAGPILIMFMPLSKIIPLLVLLDFVAAFGNLLQSRRDVVKPELLRLLPCMAIGCTLGVIFLLNLHSDLLLLLMGLFISTYAIYSLAVRPSPRPWLPAGRSPWAWWADCLVRCLAVAAFICDLSEQPPAQGRRAGDPKRVDQREHGGAPESVLIAGVYAELPLLMLAVCLLPAMALGLWAGRRLTLRMSREAFVRLVTWLVLASGIALIGRYLST